MWNPFKKNAPTLLTDADKKQLVEAIQLAEHSTSGEIRVYVESKLGKLDPLERAQAIFIKHKMYETKERNAVLVYVAVNDRKLAIYADQAIHNKMGTPFWDKQVQLMVQHFKSFNYVSGIKTVIGEIGQALSSHFPYDRLYDTNELSDEIMIGK